jgi:hypothetical protein
MIEHPFRDPPDDGSMEQCDDCGEWMEWDVDPDEDGAYVNSWCQACEDAS